MDHQLLAVLATALLIVAAPAQQPDAPPAVKVVAPGLQQPDSHTLVGDRSFLGGYRPILADGSVQVVIEIPTGTVQKWEVDKSDGALRWELEDGAPRVVQYLGYPGNYGMVPRTLLPKALGGDGDPLDVLVLGPAVPRGSVVQVRLLGVLRLLDGGEKDDKLLAVMKGTPLAAAADLQQLDEKFPGVTSIVETWFSSYKGPGVVESKGFGSAADAREILKKSIEAFSLAGIEVPAPIGGSPVGAWELDAEATAAAMLVAMEKSLEGKSDAEKAMAKGMMGPMLEMFKKMKVAMKIEAAGTFTGQAELPDGSDDEVHGTWKLEGGKLSMTSDEEGKAQTMTGTVRGDILTMTQAEGGMEISMVFKRK